MVKRQDHQVLPRLSQQSSLADSQVSYLPLFNFYPKNKRILLAYDLVDRDGGSGNIPTCCVLALRTQLHARHGPSNVYFFKQDSRKLFEHHWNRGKVQQRALDEKSRGLLSSVPQVPLASSDEVWRPLLPRNGPQRRNRKGNIH